MDKHYYFCYHEIVKPKHQQTMVREILELSPNPTKEEITRNYKRLVKQYHPDICKDPNAEEAMKRINKAYVIATGKEKPIQPPPQQQPMQPTIIIRWGYGGTTTAFTNGTGGWYW